MQSNKRSELTDAIRCSVRQFRDAGQRFMNKSIVDAVIEGNGPLFAEVGHALARKSSSILTRRIMKSSAEMTEDEGATRAWTRPCQLRDARMIAVPVDPANSLHGDCEWVPVTEATVADLDANLIMLEFQIKSGPE